MSSFKSIHETRRGIDGFLILRRSLRRREGGGSSIPGLCIVGFARIPAAGVWEVAAWCVCSACFSSGGGVPWNLVVVRLASRCSGPLGLELSALDPARIWRLKTVDWSFATTPMDRGVTSSGAVRSDFPAAQGLDSSIQGSSTSSGSSAPPSRHGCQRGRDLEGLLCNFFGFLGLSVRSKF